jgi:hypothetical protein
MEEIQEARRKIDALEIALRKTGTTQLLTPSVKNAGIEQVHCAIIECLRSMADALEKIERQSGKD